MVLKNYSKSFNDLHAGRIQLASQADDGGIDCPEGGSGWYNT